MEDPPTARANESKVRYFGGCHCEAVRWAIELAAPEARVIDCNCSICTRKGYLHLIVDREDFTLLSGADDLREYRFGTKTAVHKFCRHCGIHSFYVPRSHPDGISVNARCIDDVDLADFDIEPFDGRNWEENVGELRE